MKREGILRSIVFGTEDSLVSTVGFISGIAVASVDRRTILLSGIVLVCVEAFSMGLGSTLSEESVSEARARRGVRWSSAIRDGLVMFVAYVCAGFMVLVPYMVGDIADAFSQSIGVSLALLFVLGVSSARMSGLPVISRGFRMMILGGLAIALGVGVARLLS